jgi:hypothetical protein
MDFWNDPAVLAVLREILIAVLVALLAYIRGVAAIRKDIANYKRDLADDLADNQDAASASIVGAENAAFWSASNKHGTLTVSIAKVEPLPDVKTPSPQWDERTLAYAPSTPRAPILN